MKAPRTSSAGPTNRYAVSVRSRCRRRAGADTARRTAIDSANGVLPLSCLLRRRFDVGHHRLAVLAAGVDGLPALVHGLLDGRREQNTRRAGRLELQEFGIQRILQPGNLEGQG